MYDSGRGTEIPAEVEVAAGQETRPIGGPLAKNQTAPEMITL